MIPIVPQPPAWFVQVPLDSKLPDVPVLLRLGCSSQHQARRQHELATAQQVRRGVDAAGHRLELRGTAG